MKQNRHIGLRIGLCLLIFAVALTVGCSRKEEGEISIRLKWLHQAQFAGFYYAKEAGLYSENGLDVTLHPGGVDYPAIQLVASGSDDFGVTGADQILLARAKGVPVVAIACIYRKSPFVLFTLSESGIRSLEDAKGKRVGVKLGGNEELTYRAMLKKAGMNASDVTEVPVKFDITPLLTGQIDVWPGYSINEPITAEEQGHEVNLIWPDHYGIHLYADVLFTTEEMIRTNPQTVTAVVRATVRGWQEAFKSPDKAVQFTIQQSNQLSAEHERRMLDASAALVKPDKEAIGWMDEDTWSSMARMLQDSGFLKHDVSVREAFRVDFLPKR